MSSSSLLFVIVGRSEPLYEAEFQKRGNTSDSVARQNYFVLHSALDLVEKAAWATNNMNLRVVDKVGPSDTRMLLTMKPSTGCFQE
jgi:trafficking protein particle complex subunit 2